MKTKNIVFVALFTAVLCVVAPLCLPIGIVPVSLATFVVYISGAVLGGKKAAFAVLMYILLGVAGLPVFSGFSGGLQRIASPLGGFILSYVPCAVVVATFSKNTKKLSGYIFSMFIATLLCYIIGLLWFVIFTKTTLVQGIIVCVLPFVLGDAVKIILASAVSVKLKSHIKLF